jgi:hypothetical protein
MSLKIEVAMNKKKWQEQEQEQVAKLTKGARARQLYLSYIPMIWRLMFIMVPNSDV